MIIHSFAVQLKAGYNILSFSRKRSFHINKGLVSIIIPCWNARNYIEKCFNSVKAQSYASIEVVVVDNGSSDDSKELIRRLSNGLKISIIENRKNLGFSKALNQGIEASKGEFVLALNLDVELMPDYIEKLVAAFKDPSIGSATGKLYRLPEMTGGKKILDSTGHVLLASRVVLNRGDEEEDVSQFDAKKKIFGVCAAAAMYRREMLEQVKISGEYFDSDFFASYEDVDLDWRAANAGWNSIFAPEAVGYHVRRAFGWNATDEMLSNSRRNKFLSVVKNEFFLNFLIDLPILVAHGLENLLYNHYKNYRLFALTIVKKFSAFPRALRKRFEARKTRKISPFAFRKHIAYGREDWLKVRDLIGLLAVILLLTRLIGGRNTFFLAIFIFFIFNPAVYYLKGGSAKSEKD